VKYMIVFLCLGINDVDQMSDKTAEITPPLCVARVASSGDEICFVTAPTEELGKWP
jgi:hypothetical protein